jgi:hypothetical protein
MSAATLLATVVPSAIFLALSAHFAAAAWAGRGKLALDDRWRLLTRSISAVAVCAVAILLINWATVPPLVWLCGVALLALGIAGAMLRWPALPWFAAGAARSRRIVGIAADILFSTLLIGAAFA